MDEILIGSVLLFILVAVIMAIVRVVGWFIRLFVGQPTPTPPTSQDALRKLRNELEHLTHVGVIDAEARDELTNAIRSQELRLLEKRLARKAAVANEARPMAAMPPTIAPIPPQPISERPALLPAGSSSAPATPLPLSERAAIYATSRAAAVAEVEEASASPAVPVKPREPSVPFSRLMAAFMEDKNIRWGELVGGLLIVGCSIALVISFWSEIASRPLLKFGLFNGVTAALFGVGLYTERRWKIHTTSHGLLVIATLLVPLNFLAIAAFTQQTPPTDALSLAGEGLSLMVFATLVYFAGVTLVPRDAWLLVVGVMLPSLMQLLVRRFAEPSTPLTWLYALASVPIIGYLVTTGAAMWRRWKTEDKAESAEPEVKQDEGAARVSPPRLLPEEESEKEIAANRVLVFLGLVSAATLLPLALLAFKVRPLETTVHWLSPLVAPCGLPALLVGLWFWRTMTDRRLTGLQTAGIGVGALGAIVMAGAVILAWPDPATLLPTTLLTGVVLTVVALVFGIPAAYVPAGVAFAAAALIGHYVAHGEVGWTLESYEPMKQSLISAMSGHVLVPLVALFGGLAWGLSRLGRREDGKMVGFVAAGTAVASLALVLWFGWGRVGDPANATWTLAIYAIAAVAAATRFDRAEVAWAAAVLVLAAMLQGIVYRYGAVWELERPWVTALLAYATVCAVGRAAIEWIKPTPVHWRRALEGSGLVASVAAAGLIVASAQTTSADALAVNLAWLAGVWLVLAALARWPALFTASQVAIVAAILCAVTAAVEGRDWYADAKYPWLDPWFLQAQGIALAGYCLIYGAVRWTLTRFAKQQASEKPRTAWNKWVGIERVVEGVLVLLLLAVAIYAVVPGIAQELAPLEAARGAGPAVRVVTPIEQYELAGIAHAHAGSMGAWVLLAAVSVALAVAIWEKKSLSRLQGLLLAAATVCPLLAFHWEGDVAVASALRWLLAGFFAALSTPIWWLQQKELPTRAAHASRNILVAVIVLAYLAMGVYVFSAVLTRFGMAPNVDWLWPYLLCWAAVAGLTALVISRVSGARLTTVLHARDVLLLLAVGPLAILVTFAVAMALDQHPIVGPELTSWFRKIGWDWCYGVPLVVMALVFVGYAIRDRSSRFAFAAGMLTNIVATIALLVRLARGGGALDGTAWVTVAQVNAIVAGAVALVWLGAIKQGARSTEQGELHAPRSVLPAFLPWLLITQVALAAALCGTFLLPISLGIAVSPARAGWVPQANVAIGWAAVALVTVATGWIQWRRGVSQNGVSLFTATLVAMGAITAVRWDTGNWEAFHTLLMGCCVAAWIVPWATRGANQWCGLGSEGAEPPAMKWSALAVRLFAVATVVLALRAVDDAPGMSLLRVTAPLAALVAISARNVWIAWWERRRGFIWIAAVLFPLAVSIWWINHGFRLTGAPGSFESGSILWVNILAAAIMAVISVWVERTRILPAAATLTVDENPRRWRGIAFHRFASWAIVIAMSWMIGARLLDDLWGNPWPTSAPLAWAAWVAALVAAVACWWDPATRWPVACIYCVGLMAVGLFLDGLNFTTPMFQWALALALSSYSLVTSGLWSVRDRLRAMGARLGVPVADDKLLLGRGLGAERQATDGAGWFEGSGQGWLVSANFLIGIFVLALVWWIEISLPKFGQRMIAAYAIGAQVFALGLLARGVVRTSLQYLALVWGAFFAVAFGWAWLPPDFESPWLHRLIVTVAALTVAVVAYGFGFVKFLQRENEWTRAAGRLVPVLAVVAAALFLTVLGIEVTAFVQGRELHVAWPALLAVALALVGLMVAALAAALLPGRDPLGLSERGRTAYVYAAEALAALLFLHIRVTMPWLFSGWFTRFWPMIVMVLAFAGVGLGEVFQRRRQQVLSEPLQSTGVLLPLLPALGFWFMSSQVHYSLLLLSIGVLYAALSVLRKSFWFAVLAGVAANGSLWYFLHTGEGLGLLQHPQLWLIPPALSALAAGYINRERLSREQATALRYGAAIVIYASSTADMFINGVADAPWLPAVLAGLSILGVLAGILLRVQSFLYLGTTFLVVALMTVIWHAAIEQQRTWILWVAGIVTGALIIAMFGLFEKRRDDVLRVVDQLKHWQA